MEKLHFRVSALGDCLDSCPFGYKKTKYETRIGSSSCHTCHNNITIDKYNDTEPCIYCRLYNNDMRMKKITKLLSNG